MLNQAVTQKFKVDGPYAMLWCMPNIKCCCNRCNKPPCQIKNIYSIYMYMFMTVVYEGAVDMSDEKQKSAVLCACAMVTYAQGDTNKCKTFLFKA